MFAAARFTKLPAGISQCPQRIETSLDGTITTPTHYTGMSRSDGSFRRNVLEASYIGRRTGICCRPRRDGAEQPGDPKSGMDWYTAAGICTILRAANVDLITFLHRLLENLFPNLGEILGIPGWSSTQSVYQIVAGKILRIGYYDVLDWAWCSLRSMITAYRTCSATEVRGIPHTVR